MSVWGERGASAPCLFCGLCTGSVRPHAPGDQPDRSVPPFLLGAAGQRVAGEPLEDGDWRLVGEHEAKAPDDEGLLKHVLAA